MKKIIYLLLCSLPLASCGSSKQITTTTTIIEYRDTTIIGDSIPCPDVITSQTVTTEQPKWQVKKEINLENKKHRRETKAKKQVDKAEIKSDKKVEVVKAKEETKQNESDNKAQTKQKKSEDKAEVQINKQDNKAEVKIKKKNSWWRILLIGIVIGFFLRAIIKIILRYFGIKFN